MKPVNIIIPLICIVFSMTKTGACADTNTYVSTYPLKWANLDQIAEVVQDLIGESGKVYKYTSGNELIISASSNQHQQVSTLIKSLDLPVPNVRLDIDMNLDTKSSDTGLGLEGSGKVIIKPGRNGTQFKFTPKARYQTTHSIDNTRQILVVQSGREASLHIGEIIPYADWLFYYGKSHGYIDFDFNFTYRPIGASLIAEPRVIGKGPLLTITLTPELTVLVGDEHKRFRFTKVSTTVTGTDGQPINLGGLSNNSEFYSKFLVGYDSSGSVKTTSIILTPHITYPGVK